MTLQPGNPMTKVLMALLVFEVIVFGLSIATMVQVDEVALLPALAAGGGASVLAVAAAATMRRPLGYALGWLTQLVALALGLLTPSMFAMGGVFVLLWVITFVLGRRLDALRATGGQ